MWIDPHEKFSKSIVYVVVLVTVSVEFENVVNSTSSNKIICGAITTNASEKIITGATHIILTVAIDFVNGVDFIEL